MIIGTGMMVIGLVAVIAGIVLTLQGGALGIPAKMRMPAGVFVGIIGLMIALLATSVNIGKEQLGVVHSHLGKPMEPGQIVAREGQKGPREEILPPGMHFFIWPWKYDIEKYNSAFIEEGFIGELVAKDGKSLPDGVIYAPKWDDVRNMLNAKRFLMSEDELVEAGIDPESGIGYRGPQTTVLTPGRWRFNPVLFQCTKKPALRVDIGEVAVIKANEGPEYIPEDGSDVQRVNGVPMVPQGYRGVWDKALLPKTYYLHTGAYERVKIASTKRVYSYTSQGSIRTKSDRPDENNSIQVRSKDGYEFPVDVRVSVKVTADDAPYVVAMLADPDADDNQDGFDTLEERAILPSLRSIFRNTAEKKGALDYVASRSNIETDATTQFKNDMNVYSIDVDKVYVADIGLSRTPEGKELLKTQTDKQLAEQQQATYKEQEKAERQRAVVVKQKELADQEKYKAASEASKTIAENEGIALQNKAVGEAAAYAEKIKAFGGVDQYLKALVLERAVEIAPQVKLPENLTVVLGNGSEDLNSSIMTPLLAKMLEHAQKEGAVNVK